MAREHAMIEPFEDRQVRKGVISYGVSSYGYDMRVAREFRIFTNVLNSIVDPKSFDPKSFVEWEGDVCIVPPNSFALARSVEYFRIPRNVLTVTVGKSTYARCGIITNVTPFEPEWEGFVTLEISNTTPLPAKIYANEGIAQVLFFRGEEEPEVSYKDKGGKYQARSASRYRSFELFGNGASHGSARTQTDGHGISDATSFLSKSEPLRTLPVGIHLAVVKETSSVLRRTFAVPCPSVCARTVRGRLFRTSACPAEDLFVRFVAIATR